MNETHIRHSKDVMDVLSTGDSLISEPVDGVYSVKKVFLQNFAKCHRKAAVSRPLF